MSQPTALITVRHYQALAGLALVAMFLFQLQQPLALPLNLLMLLVGAIGILYQVRLSPVFVLLALAIGHLVEHSQQHEFIDRRAFRFLDLADVLPCLATLTYLIAQYRLHGLRFGVLPEDTRQPAEVQTRSVQSLNAAELAGLVVPIPLCALIAEIAGYALKHPWTVLDLLPRSKQLLAVAWLLLLLMFTAAQGFR